MKKTIKLNGDIKIKIDTGSGRNTTAQVFLHERAHKGKLFKNTATIDEIKSWADKFTPKYKVVSPDGIAIDYFTNDYHGITEAMKAFKVWAKQFKKQGYYSSAKHGRIHLLDLEDFCEFILQK